MNDWELVAVHEAGHVVIGDVLGLPTPEVILVLGDHGHVRQGPWDRLPLVHDQGLAALATADLAGTAASAIFGHPEPLRGAMHDVRQVMAIVQVLDPERADACVDELVERAYALCARHRGAIGRLAETLGAASGRLAGEEVRIALDAAREGRPTPRFDAGARFDRMRMRRQTFEQMPGADYGTGEQLEELWHEVDRKIADPEGWMPPGWRLPPAVPTPAVDARYRFGAALTKSWTEALSVVGSRGMAMRRTCYAGPRVIDAAFAPGRRSSRRRPCSRDPNLEVRA